MSKIDTLVKKLLEAKEAYYNDEPIISDEEFDMMEDELRKLDFDNDYFNIVGSVNNKAKVKHDYPILSMDKGKTIDDIEKWFEKIKCKEEAFLVQPKIDGMSSSIIYENGKLIRIATRGDGTIGQDITHLSNYIKIPKTIKDKNRIEVRGEMYLPKNTKLSNPENKPLRNLCGGLINRKETGLEDLKHINFISYQVIGTKIKSEIQKMEWLQENNFNVVRFFECFNIEDLKKIYNEYLDTMRDDWLYETDGLVITIDDNTLWEKINSEYEITHHNYYNIALKPPSKSKETILEDIEWNVSRSGKLIPVAIVKPVVIAQRKVTRASLTCYENVVRMKFERGDKVLIEVANDVIPYLTENVSKNIRQR